MNTKNVVVAESLVYRGNVSMMTIRFPELFKEAVRLNVPGIILGHNHPSGDPTASSEDVHITREAMQVAELLQIELYDHLVIGGDDRWVSICELLRSEDRR